jgi:hypothetical protein
MSKAKAGLAPIEVSETWIEVPTITKDRLPPHPYACAFALHDGRTFWFEEEFMPPKFYRHFAEHVLEVILPPYQTSTTVLINESSLLTILKRELPRRGFSVSAEEVWGGCYWPRASHVPSLSDVWPEILSYHGSFAFEGGKLGTTNVLYFANECEATLFRLSI